MRLDAYLASQHSNLSRASIQKLIRDGHATVNGTVVKKPAYDIEGDAVVTFKEPEKTDYTAVIAAFQKQVLFENDNVVVINKPAGMLTHSKGELNDEFTVADFVRSRFDDSEAAENASNNRLGIVHRLDRATSGVLICAKNLKTASFLQKQFSERKAHKTYLALIERTPRHLSAQIDLPIARDIRRPSAFKVDGKGKSAITNYQVVKLFSGGTALVELKPLTGRTHQLRVHLSHIGAPIIGDPVYGHGKYGDRLWLHAYQLEITVPCDNGNQRMTFTADLPHDFQHAIEERHEI